MRKAAKMVFVIFMLFNGILYADDKVTIAILDLNPKGVPKIVANAVSDIVRSEFVNIANFTVVERSQMKAVFEEQGLQMTGCTDSACAVKFGKLLSAKRIVVGEVNKIGSGALITIRYVDVANGSSLFSAKEKSDTIDDIDKAAEKAAKSLAQRIVEGDKEILTAKSPTEYYVRSIIPGLGQFYAERPVEGSIFAGLFVASCTAVYFAWADYNKKDKAYHDLERGSAGFDSAYDKYEKAGLYFDISLGIVGFVYLAHWIDVLFFAKPDFGSGPSSEHQAANSVYYNFFSLTPVSTQAYNGIGIAANFRF